MIVFVLIILGLVLVTSYKNFSIKNEKFNFLFFAIIIIHFCGFIINCLYIEANDSIAFYQRAIEADNWLNLFGIGSKSMSFLIYPLTKAGFNFFSISLLCATISLKGYFIYLETFSKEILKLKKEHIFLILVFVLPSIHIWTSSLYKESILFTLMAVVVSELHKNRVFTVKMLFILLLITIIRPYISLFLIFSIVIVYHKIILRKYKIATLTLITVISIALVNFLKVYNLSSFNAHLNKIIIYSSNKGSSSIDLLNSNYFERFFLVLFRPYFYDSKTPFQFFVSIENFIFSVIFIYFIYKIYKHGFYFKRIENNGYIVLLFSISCILFYSVYMYNLGLASRMRVMFLPYLLIGMYKIIALKKL